jgi:glycosyltransferase involved in cell wall biosynthesis
MRILYLVTRADMGGAQVHLLELLRGFRSTLDASVVVGEEGYFTSAVQGLGVPVHIVPNLVHPISPFKDARAVLDVIRVIRTVQPHLVHAHTSKAGLIGRLAASAVRVPAVFTAHTWCFAEGTSWKWQIAGMPAERVTGWLSAAIINVSDANRELALRHRISREKRMLTIWNGIPDTTHRAKPGTTGTPNIVMVARFVPQKDQALLIAALSGIEGSAKVTLVGDGPTLTDVNADVERLRLRDRVEFLGARQDVTEILAKSHIFALSTRWEGLPLSILEAMRAGLPVVATDTGGVSEAVVEGQTGFLTPCGDARALRDRLAQLIGDPALRARMGSVGRTRYLRNFTVDRMLQKTLAVYHMAALGVHAAHSLPLSLTKAKI